MVQSGNPHFGKPPFGTDTEKNRTKTGLLSARVASLADKNPVRELEHSLHNIKASSLHLAVFMSDQKLQIPQRNKQIE